MADYIATVRAHIGHDVLMLPTTALIMLDDADRLLLHRRSDNGRWSCPGGIVDLGETILSSAIREAREETGLSIDDAELFGIFAGNEFRAEYPNGDRTAVVQFVFIARSWHGRVRIDGESTDIRFFDLEALPEAIPPSHAGFLRYLPEHLRSARALPIIP
jgi:ADP-ribose pyrophosphatase YjhB (NUDIX family)